MGGIFDLADHSFQLVDITAQVNGGFKFSGAVPAAGGKIIFPPLSAKGVGIFDPGVRAPVVMQVGATKQESGLTITCTTLAGNILGEICEVDLDMTWASLTQLLSERISTSSGHSLEDSPHST